METRNCSRYSKNVGEWFYVCAFYHCLAFTLTNCQAPRHVGTGGSAVPLTLLKSDVHLSSFAAKLNIDPLLPLLFRTKIPSNMKSFCDLMWPRYSFRSIPAERSTTTQSPTCRSLSRHFFYSGQSWVALLIQDRSPESRPVVSLNQSQTQLMRPVAPVLVCKAPLVFQTPHPDYSFHQVQRQVTGLNHRLIVALLIQDRSPESRPVVSLNQSQTQLMRPVAPFLVCNAPLVFQTPHPDYSFHQVQRQVTGLNHRLMKSITELMVHHSHCWYQYRCWCQNQNWNLMNVNFTWNLHAGVWLCRCEFWLCWCHHHCQCDPISSTTCISTSSTGYVTWICEVICAHRLSSRNTPCVLSVFSSAFYCLQLTASLSTWLLILRSGWWQSGQHSILIKWTGSTGPETLL